MHCSAFVRLFKQLCLLPPPFNDVGPTFATILVFAPATILLGKDELQAKWLGFVSPSDDLTLWVHIPLGLHLSVYWSWPFTLNIFQSLFMSSRFSPKNELQAGPALLKNLFQPLF
mmetsp:Transcript_57694/g.172153  ORF Transcript_57694/g.172153 Transcript_57694/m.172153 type:complete len:115 (+) Transcript_57694:700-1044(+)